MTDPTAADTFLAHFGARGMRWGHLDASSQAEENGGSGGGSAPFIRRADGSQQPVSPSPAPFIQRAQVAQQQAQDAEQQSQVADQQSQQAMQQLQTLQAEQTQVATQAHIAAQAQAAAQPPPPTAASAAATAKAEKAHLAEITAANKEAAKAQAAQKVLENKLAKANAKLKSIAAKAKLAKAKAALKKAHAAKLKAIAKKAKEAHAKHKALTPAQKAKKAAYAKAHPHSGTHKPLTAAQKAAKNAKAKAAYAKKHPVVHKPAPKKTVVHKPAPKKTVVHKPAPKKPSFALPPTSVAKSISATKAKVAAIVNAHRITHGIDNAGALLPHAQPVKKGGPPVVVTKEPTTAQRKMFAKMGIAMPDGSYYVRDGADLQNAIDSVGRGENAGDSGAAIRKHIMARAAKLKLSSKIPATWNPDGSLKHDDLDTEIAEFFAHFGVKGMHWGVRRPRGETSASPESIDAARARKTQDTINKHGISAVSSADLQHLVSRQKLEEQHGKSNHPEISAGKKFLDDLLKSQLDAGQREANKVVAEYASKGAVIAAKYATRQFLGTSSGVGKHA
jgi:hypothetical protein